MSDTHRTILTRQWEGGEGLINWIMLNPSTADEQKDDPTIRKCRGFSKRWGFNRMVVTNLFSFRATHPRDLREVVRCDYARAVGINDGPLIEQAGKANMIVAAWGNNGYIAGRADDVMFRVLPDAKFYCIGFTGTGFPTHPCMAPYTVSPLRYR